MKNFILVDIFYIPFSPLRSFWIFAKDLFPGVED